MEMNLGKCNNAIRCSGKVSLSLANQLYKNINNAPILTNPKSCYI